jgi:hypothetical protein
MSTLRDTETYRKMDAFQAVDIVEITGGSEEDQLIAWQWLHDIRLAYSLQGWYGRSAQSLIEQGLIEAERQPMSNTVEDKIADGLGYDSHVHLRDDEEEQFGEGDPADYGDN